MAADPVYLDHNATTPIARQVAEAMWPHLTEDFGNPSSASVQGRRARAALDRAREQVAALVCAHPDEIVFTSGGTEADNLAVNFFLCASTPTQMAALACFTPEALASCEARRVELKARRRIVLDGLKRIGLPVPAKPDGAFYAWADCRAACDKLFDPASAARSVSSAASSGSNPWRQ